MIMNILMLFIISYFLGCFNSAYYYAALRGENIFTLGSGNGGATNIKRLFGVKAAALVFAVDILKTIAALYLADYLFPQNIYMHGLALFAVVLGHNFPLQLKFKGGIGMACLIGAGLYLFSIKAILSLGIVFVIVYSMLRLNKTAKPYKKAKYAVLAISPFIAFFDIGALAFALIMPSFALSVYKNMQRRSFKFKTADTESEFKQIDKLNYETFVEEIPQHQQNQDRLLRDKFHAKNSYIICKYGEEVAAMLALNTERPFSLDAKIPELDKYIPQHINKAGLCEIRLLSIKKNYRKGKILQGLIQEVFLYKKKHNIEALLISGTTRQLKMYKKFGFRPFYKLTGSEGAMFQPMIMDVKEIEVNKWKK